jgi:tetratricopeptide (TPR) repeat protein
VASVEVKPQVTAGSNSNFLYKDSRIRTILLSLLLAVVTIAVYSPVHDHPFVNLDDPKYVTQNPHIAQGLTSNSVFWAFTHGYAGNWHPLTWVSHALDISLFGLDPAPHHDENVLLHALNAVLLFWVLKRATGYTGRSLMVAALFALHPLNVESVAWVAERKTMLSTLFCLLALAAYRWYARKPTVGPYIVMAGLFILGLWSKPQIIMLPLVLLLWDYWPLQRMFAASAPPKTAPEAIPAKSFGWLVKEKLPLFFICIVDAGVTMVAQHVAATPQPYALWIRIGNALVSYTRYIRKAFWPTNLALYYPHPGKTLTLLQIGSALVVLLLITVLAVRARRHRYYIVGWLWFLIMLVPMIGLVQADVQGMADRYAYNSFVGLFLMICWGVADWAAEQHLPKILLPAVSVLVLAALTTVTWRQIGYWQDDVTLWAHSAQVTTGNWKAEYFLGGGLDGAGRHTEAIEHYLRAGQMEPEDPFVNLSIAGYEQNHGNPEAALDYYKKVLAYAWNGEQSTTALNNMAVIYRQLGDPAKADACLNKVQAIPQKPAVDWQGAWWRQIIPVIKEYFHSGAKAQS